MPPVTPHAVRDRPPVSEVEEDRSAPLPSDTFVSDPLIWWIRAFLLVPPLIFSLPQGSELDRYDGLRQRAPGRGRARDDRGADLDYEQQEVDAATSTSILWWENLLLFAIGAIGLWATYNLITETYAALAGLFGS